MKKSERELIGMFIHKINKSLEKQQSEIKETLNDIRRLIGPADDIVGERGRQTGDSTKRYGPGNSA